MWAMIAWKETIFSISKWSKFFLQLCLCFCFKYSLHYLRFCLCSSLNKLFRVLIFFIHLYSHLNFNHTILSHSLLLCLETVTWALVSTSSSVVLCMKQISQINDYINIHAIVMYSYEGLVTETKTSLSSHVSLELEKNCYCFK